MAVQLKLFQIHKSEHEELEDELDIVSDKLENLRKGLFKRHSTLAAEVRSLQTQIDFMQAQMFVMEQYIKNFLIGANKSSGALTREQGLEAKEE